MGLGGRWPPGGQSREPWASLQFPSANSAKHRKDRGELPGYLRKTARTQPLLGVVSSLALRDTFDGVGVGRKTGSEADEAIR